MRSRSSAIKGMSCAAEAAAAALCESGLHSAKGWLLMELSELSSCSRSGIDDVSDDAASSSPFAAALCSAMSAPTATFLCCCWLSSGTAPAACNPHTDYCSHVHGLRGSKAMVLASRLRLRA